MSRQQHLMSSEPLRSPVRFFRGAPLHSGRVGVFPGAFNPLTRAHLALAHAARDQHSLDQVVFLVPRVLPHKAFEGASFDERVTMLQGALADEPDFAIASTDGGLVVEIVRAFRAVCGEEVEFFVLCGRDAAERFVRWDYGELPSFSEQLREFQMLVASREGEYSVSSEYTARIHLLQMPAGYDEDSSSVIRELILAGGDWERLVPEGVARRIREKGLYLGD